MSSQVTWLVRTTDLLGHFMLVCICVCVCVCVATLPLANCLTIHTLIHEHNNIWVYTIYSVCVYSLRHTVSLHDINNICLHMIQISKRCVIKGSLHSKPASLLE